MSFGLSYPVVTLMSLMNKVFNSLLDCFISVFVYDI